MANNDDSNAIFLASLIARHPYGDLPVGSHNFNQVFEKQKQVETDMIPHPMHYLPEEGSISEIVILSMTNEHILEDLQLTEGEMDSESVLDSGSIKYNEDPLVIPVWSKDFDEVGN